MTIMTNLDVYLANLKREFHLTPCSIVQPYVSVLYVNNLIYYTFQISLYIIQISSGSGTW